MFLKRIQNDVDLLGRVTVKSHWGAPEKDDKNGGGQSERLNLSLRSRRLEVMGTKKTERARDARTQGKMEPCPLACLPRAARFFFTSKHPLRRLVQP